MHTSARQGGVIPPAPGSTASPDPASGSSALLSVGRKRGAQVINTGRSTDTCLPRASEPYPDLWQSTTKGRHWCGQCSAHVPSLNLVSGKWGLCQEKLNCLTLPTQNMPCSSLSHPTLGRRSSQRSTTAKRGGSGQYLRHLPQWQSPSCCSVTALRTASFIKHQQSILL